MTHVTEPVTGQPESANRAALALVATVLTFVAGVLWLLLGVGAWMGLCLSPDDPTNLGCSAESIPTKAEWVLATMPTLVLWVAAPVAAVVLGRRAWRSGNPTAKTVTIIAGVVAAALAAFYVVAFLLW